MSLSTAKSLVWKDREEFHNSAPTEKKTQKWNINGSTLDNKCNSLQTNRKNYIRIQMEE